jgi:hypothetical protein
MGGTSPEGAGADRTSGPIAGWQRVRGVDAQAQRFDPCAFLIGIPVNTEYLENVRGHLATLATRESAILRDALDRSGTLSARDEARLAEIREERTLSEANLGKMLKDTEREQRAREIAIPASTFGRRENGSYAERRSFLRDLAAASTGDTHAADLVRSHDDLRRTELQDEGRSILTSTGIGSFTPRIVAPGEAFPGTGSPFWDWLGPMQLPEGGEVRLPRFTEAFVGGVQTAEGTALAASTPTVSDAVGTVRTFGAATTLTYQSLELSTPDFDNAIFEGLGRAYATSLEDAALNGSGTGTFKGALAFGTADGSHVINLAGTVAPTGPQFVEALAEAVSTVVDAVYETDLAIFVHPRRLGYLQSLVDDGGRPYVAPFSPGTGRASEDVRGYGSTAAVARFGGNPIFTTSGIGTSYGDGEDEDRVLVIARGAMRAWQAAPGPRRITVDPDGSTLRYRVAVYNFAAMLAARPEGIATIRGNLGAPFA